MNNLVMHESLFCPVCERKTQNKYVREYRAKLELFKKKELYKCLECSVIFVNPLPTAAQLDEYYKLNWRTDKDIYAESNEMHMVLKMQSDQRRDYLISHNVLSPCSKVLDVGSGDGYFLQSLQNKGFKDVNMFAVEPNPKCFQKLKALGINTVDSLQEVSERSFDLITLGETLEHIAEPILFLKSIMELVNNCGHIYIDVPERDDTHKIILEPHVLFYSKKSILYLAEKMNLKVVHVTGFGVKRGSFIFPKSLLHRGLCKIRKLFNQAFVRGTENNKLQKNLSNLYQFDREGDEGWWIRIILKKEMSFTHSIMFHHFHSNKHAPAQGSLSAEEFEEMLDWLGNRYNLVNANEYLLKFEKNYLQPNDICLSFDDALLCQFDVAVPVLRKRSIQAFFFVYSSVFTGNHELLEIFRYFRTSRFDHIDDFYRIFFNAVKSNDESLYQSTYETFKNLDYLAEFPVYSDNDKFFRYLRDQVLGVENYNSLMLDMMQQESFDIPDAASLLWMKDENLNELHKEGHLIGLHSYSHPTQISKLTVAEQQGQYRRNMEHLEGLLGIGSICSMSHPGGDYNADTLGLLTDMGIRIGFRSSLSVKEIKSPLEVPRNDHANIFREMRK